MMNYTIYINQKALSELTPKITYEEAAVLDYITKICESNNREIKEKRKDGYTWVNYRSLIKQMPLLKSKTKAGITAKINNLEKYGFIQTKIIYNKQKQKCKYIKLTDLCNYLFNPDGHESNDYFYKNFREIGISETRAKVMSSDPDFIQNKEIMLEKIFSKKYKPVDEEIKDRSAYIWSIYQGFKSGGY